MRKADSTWTYDARVINKRVYGGQYDMQEWFTATGEFNFYEDGINKWGKTMKQI